MRRKPLFSNPENLLKWPLVARQNIRADWYISPFAPSLLPDIVGAATGPSVRRFSIRFGHHSKEHLVLWKKQINDISMDQTYIYIYFCSSDIVIDQH